ncbi:MAG: DNA-processing protein DprA [Erysipelotrichaceae bacterium]|nr:DNA-processing protein DprA [Erysipelotrichaceae bacterium]MDD3808767.1 DNA-processing protein DprA [Erysipelotrichaceae bacterium]
MREILLYFALKYEGDFTGIYNALHKKEKVDMNGLQELTAKVNSHYVTIIDDNYPEALKHISSPPFVLFYHGDLTLLDNDLIAVIGMRKASEYGKKAADFFTRQLVESGYVIISGMALGIDYYAHQEALSSSGNTVAVLGSGINNCYPKRHQELYEDLKSSQLIISEYPDTTKAAPGNFPSRNRIIAGLASKILVVEARERSGTMITVGFGLEAGKDIYCVPGRFDENRGCNMLIQQGAKLVLGVGDILD